MEISRSTLRGDVAGWNTATLLPQIDRTCMQEILDLFRLNINVLLSEVFSSLCLIGCNLSEFNLLEVLY